MKVYYDLINFPNNETLFRNKMRFTYRCANEKFVSFKKTIPTSEKMMNAL